MKKSLLFKVILLVVAFSFVLAACGPAATAEEPAAEEAAAEEAAPAEEAEAEEAEAEEAAEPTKIRVAVQVDVDTWDHHGNTTIAVANLVDYMTETLVEVEPDGTIIPWLAKDWEISEDGLEYTFYLRDDVTFHDGTPFNAEAVKANIDRISDPDVEVADAYPYDQITKIEMPDEYTIKWYLDTPISSFLESMLQTNFSMVSPTFVAPGSDMYTAIGNKNGTVGTGPYVYESFSPGDKAVLVKNDNYWGEEPYYDIVEFYVVPDPATRETMLLAGDVDVAVLPPITDLPALEANPDVDVVSVPSNRFLYVAFNQDVELLQDQRVRQAINYAVDKEAINKNVMFGTGTLMNSPMPSMFFGWCETGFYEYDPEKAKELLAEAGVAEGTEIEFWAPTSRYVQDFQVAEAISGYLADIGLVAVPQTFEWSSYINSVLNIPENREDRPDMYMLGWGGTAYHGYHTMYLYTTDGFFNGHNYSNPEVDELAAAAIAEPDREKSAETYCKINNILWEEAPILFLHTQSYTVAHNSDITGISGSADEKFFTVGAHPVE